MSFRRDPASEQRQRRYDKPRSLSNLRRCSGSRADEQIKERIADELLRAAGQDQVRPVHTDRRLERQVRERCEIRADYISDRAISERPAQSALDELRFLMALTPLSQRERFFLRGWMLGWTQKETSTRWMDRFGPDGRYRVSAVLRGAMLKCNEYARLSFSAMSRRAVYRKPSTTNALWRMAICPYCRETFIRGWGDGYFCSTGCRSALDAARPVRE